MNKQEKEYWEKVMRDLDAEHPEIQINPYRFIYTGGQDYIMDLNYSYDPEDEIIAQIDGSNEVLDDDDYEEEMVFGNAMMNSLAGKDKELIKLYFEDGYSFAKIGRLPHWNCTRQNVKYHFHRIIAKLKKEFQEDYNGLQKNRDA